MDAAEQISQLAYWLKCEKEEDLRQYQAWILPMPLAEKRKKGFLWHPLRILHQGFSVGDHGRLTLERTRDQGADHVFRAGNPVRLTALSGDREGPFLLGVIHFVREDTMQIIFSASWLPDWVHGASLAVLPEFDGKSYREMEFALRTLRGTLHGPVQILKDIFFGIRQPVCTPQNIPLTQSHLNISQQEAVAHILAARELALVHGPPGTGKTTTLVSAVSSVVAEEGQVLVCAPSNTAVDLLVSRLAAMNLQVVRLGNISRVDEEILKHTLDYQIANLGEAKPIAAMRREADNLRRKAEKLEVNGNPAALKKRRVLLREATHLSDWGNQLEKKLVGLILDRAQVIACTLVGAAHTLLTGRTFRTVFIDEASQALEPATWIPILKSSKVVLCGDPFQLPPTVKSTEALRAGFGITLMDRMLAHGHAPAMLCIQYRGNERIMGFSNRYFYGDRLSASDSVRDRKLPFPDDSPLIFIDTAGAGFEERSETGTGSYCNEGEFALLREQLYRLQDTKEPEEVPAFPQAVILSPYKGQVAYIEREIAGDSRLANLALRVKTIDGFQGQESDLILISLVRSNLTGEIGFLKDYRRFNVALTRGRSQVVVVGDRVTLGRDPFFEAFFQYCEENGDYRTAWDYMA